jgi:hypothetical protein
MTFAICSGRTAGGARTLGRNSPSSCWTRARCGSFPATTRRQHATVGQLGCANTTHRALTAWAYELVASSATARAAAIDSLIERFFDGTHPTTVLDEVGLTTVETAAPPHSPAIARTDGSGHSVFGLGGSGQSMEAAARSRRSARVMGSSSSSRWACQ